LVYSVSSYFRRKKINKECLLALNKYLWAFLLAAIVLEQLDVMQKAYESREAWPALHTLLEEAIPVTHALQIYVGAAIPLVLLLIARWDKVSSKMSYWLTGISSLMVLIGVLSMRFNVVVGGQLVSKSNQGLTKFHFQAFTGEGVIPTIILLTLPVVILAVMTKLLPPWAGEEEDAVTTPEKETAVAS